VNRAKNDALEGRLAWLSALRLVLLAALLVLVGTLYLRDRQAFGDATRSVMLAVAGGGMTLSVAYSVALRLRFRLDAVSIAQLAFDQLSWSALAYVSGGASSGATSLYGLTCVTGAIVLGVRGVLVACVSAAVLYLGMCGAFIGGYLHPPSDQAASLYALTWKDASYPVTLNLLILTVVGVLAGYLAERLGRTRGELQAANRRAEEAERLALVGRIASALAHEIRNPLGAIAGSVELLSSAPGLVDEDRLLCGIIGREAARLNDLVSDMLELSKPRRPEHTAVDVARLASEVVALARASGRGTDVNVMYEGANSGIIVSADAAQLRQVIWNLLRNAIQATEAGAPVKVSVSRSEAARPVRVEIVDSGKGIPESSRGKLFDPFFTTRAHGTGIGLAVVKRVVDEHGWSIEVENGASGGATFRVLIPPASATE
jgi:signal transduction histidine kinase